MKLNFRQGLISIQSSGATQQFLQASSINGYVDLVVTTTPCVVTFAHGEADYLLKHEATIQNAWGPLVSGVDNHLYWDINLITGAVTRGITTLQPVTSLEEPANAPNGQLWFDRVNNKMMEKTSGVNPWIERVRLMAGTVPGGNPSNINVFGGFGAGISQVGLNNVAATPGFVIIDELGRPYRDSRGAFLTEETPVRVRTRGDSTGVLTSPVNNLVMVRANTFIPAYTLVHFDGEDAISPASSNPADPKAPVGIVLTDISANEVGTILQAGEITSEVWTWGAENVGKPLYSDYFGRLTLTRPQNLQVYRVGYIKNSNTILFYIDSETQAQVVAQNGAIISATPPLTAVTSVNLADEIVTTISIPAATETNDGGYMTPAQATVLNSLDGRVTVTEAGITMLTTTKANIVHSHSIADTTGLQAALDGKSPTSHNHDLVYSPIAHDHDLVYAALAHGHLISDVTDLQTELNQRAPLAHLHGIPDVSGLQGALDDRAMVNHSHAISNVTGLQLALDGKALVGHTHALDDLSDVNAAAPASGQALVWNGAAWAPGTVATTFVPSLMTTTVDLSPQRTYPNWTGLTIRNAYAGDVGVTGFIGATPPFSAYPSYSQSSDVQFNTADPALVSVSPSQTAAAIYIGAGVGVPPNATPISIGTAVQFNGPANIFFQPAFLFPAAVGDQCWVTASTFDGYSLGFSVTVVVGPTATSGEQYVLTGTTTSNDPQQFRIERLADI